MGGMDTDQLYSVRWNEFHTSIITSFRHLLDQEDFIDVTIACDGHSFTAHKVVLSACSPYFRSLLKANPCQHPIVILRDVKKQEMEALLSFMYNGEVRINQEHLPEFLKTARSLQVRGLVDFTKENQPSSWGSSSVVPVDVIGKNKASDNLPSPPYKRQRNNSEQLTTQPLTPSSSYNADRDKDTPSLLVQALELNQSQSSQNKNAVDSSVTGHSSDEEDSNSGDSDGSHTVNDTRSDVNQQNNDIVIQPQISQAQHSKLEPVDFLSSSGNNHDLHNTSISIEQQSRHSFPASISSGVSIISSLQGLPGLLPGPSGIHNNSQENSYGDGGGPTMGCYLNATEPKPVCTECGRVYSSVSNLKQHIANVHSATPHWEPCPVCGKHFKTRQYLFNHLLQTHGIRQRGSRMHMHLSSGGGGVGGGGVGGGGGHHHHHNHHHHHHPSHPSTIASSSSPLQTHSPSATISSCFSNASVVKPLMSHHADIKPLSHASVAAAAATAAAAAAADHNEQRQQQQQQQQHPPNSFVPPLPSSSSASVLNRLNNPDLSSQFYMLSKSAVTR